MISTPTERLNLLRRRHDRSRLLDQHAIRTAQSPQEALRGDQLPGAEAPQADRVSERVTQTIAGVVTDEGPSLSVTCGVAQWKRGMSVRQLTHEADTSLLSGKGADANSHAEHPTPIDADHEQDLI